MTVLLEYLDVTNNLVIFSRNQQFWPILQQWYYLQLKFEFFQDFITMYVANNVVTMYTKIN